MDISSIEVNKNSFITYNKLKIDRYLSLIPNTNMKRPLSALPLLLSINDPKLPGYVVGDVPMGVFSYEPDDDTKKFIFTKYGRAVNNLEIKNPFVQMIALIGSVGSIAYNRFSDFDYWVCVDKNTTSKEMYLNFRKKVLAIQDWMKYQNGLDVNIFINDINDLKNNVFDETEDEAFGSTMGALLKDEFYRSSIVLYGKIPFWWVVGINCNDVQYDELWKSLSKEITDSEFIDIGNLYKIEKDEFLGAALFQIVKSLGNPFKSILKMGILEKYIFSEKNQYLISQKLKFSVHQNKLSNTILDSYLLMFHEVYDYYEKSGLDNQLLEILKQNLYLKIRPQLSKYASLKMQSNMPYKVEELFRKTKKWNWTPDDIKDLDNFDNWDFNKLIAFWDKVQMFMLQTFQRISAKYQNVNIKDKISETDFYLLQRKIRSHFQRTPEKIEKFLSFKDTNCENIIYIEPSSETAGNTIWKLYKKDTGVNPSGYEIIIKVCNDLLELLVWSILNRVYDHTASRIIFQSGAKRIEINIITDFMNSVSAFFQNSRMKPKNSYFIKEVFNMLNFLVFDFAQPLGEKISSISFVYHTSWNESFINKIDNEDSLFTVLNILLNDGQFLKKPFDEYFSFYSPNVHNKIYKNYYNIFKEAYNSIVLDNNAANIRFITKVGTKYSMFTRNDGTTSGKNYDGLFQFLIDVNNNPIKNVKYIIYDSLNSHLAGLALSFENVEKNTITIFYEQKSELFFIYVITEDGNLFVFIKAKPVFEKYMSILLQFTKNISTDIRQLNRFSPLNEKRITIKMIAPDKFGKIQLTDKTDYFSTLHLSIHSRTATYEIAILEKLDSIEYTAVFEGRKTTPFILEKDNVPAALIINSKKTSRPFENIISAMFFQNKSANQAITSTKYYKAKFSIELQTENKIR